MTRSIYYAGYGALIDLDFAKALFGRVPWNQPAIVEGFDLVCMNRFELPQEIREGVQPGFQIYGLRPGTGKVKVRVFELTRAQKAAIDELHFNGALYTPADISVRTEGGRTFPVVIDLVDDRTRGLVVNGESYRPLLNGRDTMMEIASEINRKLNPIPEDSEGQKERS